MEKFGVHSEVGKLRKVIVHRPELSLQRLTPSSHDELLFDDVLWVERAHTSTTSSSHGCASGVLRCTSFAICSPKRWSPARAGTQAVGGTRGVRVHSRALSGR